MTGMDFTFDLASIYSRAAELVQHGQVPKQYLENVATTIFSLFGGPQLLDQWLTRTADIMSPRYASIQSNPFPSSGLPGGIQALTQKPADIVDLILTSLDALAVWGYSIRAEADLDHVVLTVVDELSGHVVETKRIPANQKDEHLTALTAKYGPNVKVG